MRGGLRTRAGGAVLFEVILALVLFVAAATIVTSGFNASITSLDRLRLNAHAEGLAVSVLSEVQMGIRPLESLGPEPFEKPFEAWTWEVVVSAADTSERAPLRQVEIVIRQPEEETTYRLLQLLPVPPAKEGGGAGLPTSGSAKSELGLPAFE